MSSVHDKQPCVADRCDVLMPAVYCASPKGVVQTRGRGDAAERIDCCLQNASRASSVGVLAEERLGFFLAFRGAFRCDIRCTWVKSA